MGPLVARLGAVVYLDASVVISIVENFAPDTAVLRRPPLSRLPALSANPLPIGIPCARNAGSPHNAGRPPGRRQGFQRDPVVGASPPLPIAHHPPQ